MEMPPEERLGFHLKRVEQELIALKTAAIKPSGLTVPQYSALVALAAHPGATAAALARFGKVTPQTMATTLANLESKGLVTRKPDPYHLNSTQVEITPEGRRALKIADRAAVTIERTLGDAFSAEERDALRDLLARCSASLQAQAREVDGAEAALKPFRLG
ncbi:MarR family winged helix-turn-helix transcriptional regulator [Saccharopolyspora taberi]|uniref:MarR family transcriptional regulator n=1 Tax=Saccharopolyspora taberi TaxID=60895 RepID=A0ABN3V532_9PSEU